jgi:hypothetical protein
MEPGEIGETGRFCPVMAGVWLSLVGGVSLKGFDKLQFWRDTSRDYPWHPSSKGLRDAKLIHETRLMVGLVEGLKRRTIYNASDHNEADFPLDRRCAEGLSNFRHKSPRPGRLNLWGMREQNRTDPSSLIGIAISSTPFILPCNSRSVGIVRVHRYHFLPGQDIQGYGLSYIFQGILDCHCCGRPRGTHKGKVQWFYNSVLYFYPRTISDQERFASSFSGALGGRGLLLDLRKGGVHNNFLPVGYFGVDSGSDKSKPCSNRQPYLNSTIPVAVGVLLSFYAFWNLQFGPQGGNVNWRIVRALLLLVPSFLLIAYGVYLMLDTSQTCGDASQEGAQFTLSHAGFGGRLIRGALITLFKKLSFGFGSDITPPPDWSGYSKSGASRRPILFDAGHWVAVAPYRCKQPAVIVELFRFHDSSVRLAR